MSTLAATHGTSAFARADIDDARRRRPATELHDYARERGLEFHGQAQLAGFRMALPAFPEEMHNAMRGVLPGGRFGVLLHQVVQTHANGVTGIQGTFHGVRTSDPEPFWRAFIPNRTDIPFIGGFLNPPTDKAPRRAFDTAGAWAPATTVAIPVPETGVALPGVAFLQTARTAARGGDIRDIGVPGWRAHALAPLDDAALARLADGPATEVLHQLDVPWAEVRADHAMLTVRRNGYVTDPAQLDDLARLACVFADALRSACIDGTARAASFADPLARCPWEHADAGAFLDPAMPAGWTRDIRDYASRHGMTLEDPMELGRRWPDLPVPGRVLAVARAPAGYRVVFSTQVPLRVTRAVHAAVVWESSGTPDTVRGGTRPADAGATVEVRDGLATAWPHRLFGYTREADDLRELTRQAATAAGVPGP